jgi:hypothetical protein
MMTMSILYALGAAIVALAIDWTFFGRLSNIISVARLSSGKDDPDPPYNPLKPWRPVCAVACGVLFLASEFAQRPVRDVLYAGIAVTLFVMVMFTYRECTATR